MKGNTKEPAPNTLSELFGPPISICTDADGLEDGILVGINPKDRVTRAVWEWLATGAGNGPPTGWPIDMLGWCKARTITKEEALKMLAEYGKDLADEKYRELVADRKARALAVGLIDVNRGQATRTYEQNIGGGILTLYAMVVGKEIVELSETEGLGRDLQLWLMPNELGGITLMFPGDY